MIQYPLAAILRERNIVADDDLPIFLRALRHVVKRCAVVLMFHCQILSGIMLSRLRHETRASCATKMRLDHRHGRIRAYR